ncbi:MAG: peptidylprolyl isomerase [Parvularculaceae bacterium]
MSIFSRALREPLLQFLAVGAVFFAAASVIKPPPDDERSIVVDRAALLEFIQYRSKAFDAGTANEILAGLKPEEREALIEDYIREEIAYREALKLDLEADDYVVKQRLIQKFEFLQETLIGDEPPTEKEISAWYEGHKQDYVEPPAATFAHVFFAREGRGDAASEAAAEEMVLDLMKRKAPFEAAPGKGDRFPFGVNFVDRTLDDVSSQFGEEAAVVIFNESGPFNTWRGPVRSSYGAHAVYVKKVIPGRTLALEEVRDKVIEDASRDLRERTKIGLLDGARQKYDIMIEPLSADPAP